MTKYAMPTDTRSSFAFGTVGRAGVSSISNSGLAGYPSGGQNPTTRVTLIEKLSFANDTRSTIAAVLSFATTGLAGMSNEGVF
jgi:hypothetical protein